MKIFESSTVDVNSRNLWKRAIAPSPTNFSPSQEGTSTIPVRL